MFLFQLQIQRQLLLTGMRTILEGMSADSNAPMKPPNVRTCAKMALTTSMSMPAHQDSAVYPPEAHAGIAGLRFPKLVPSSRLKLQNSTREIDFDNKVTAKSFASASMR